MTNVNEDYPILSFDSELEFATCPNVERMDTFNMDSLNFYDTDQQGIAKEETFFLDESLPSLADLDPSVELSFDLEELIKETETSAGVANSSSGELFPELQAPAASCYQYHQPPELQQQTAAPQHVEFSSNKYINNTTSGQQVVAGSTEDLLMPRVLDVESSQAGPSPLFSVKQEDLEALGLLSSNKNGVVYLKIQTVPEAEQVSSSTDKLNIAGHLSAVVEELTEKNHTTSRPPTCPTAGTRNPLKAPPAGKTCIRKRNVQKESDEYKEKRARNNVAVRKSRDKAKIRQQETEGRMTGLTRENDRLQKKVDLLTKELTVLKGLFTNVGAALPKELEDVLD